jgi:hypothetical protein
MRWNMAPPPDVGRSRYPYVFALDTAALAVLPAQTAHRRQVLKDRRRMAHETAEWCRLQYGTDDRQAARRPKPWRWTQDGTSFRFRYERDAFEFKMRWG